MSQAHASHGASKIGLRLIQRDDVQLNPAVKKKPGGFADVHQGIFDGEVVAVKIPKDTCSLTEKQFKEFIRELTVMANVKHPHCVMLLAACQNRNDPLLVIEWMCGGNLFEALGRDDPHSLPWHVRLRIAREIASAIEFLHKCKITHGDLKSLNVMLTSDLTAKVCDFGAAIQRLNSAMSLRSSHIVQGTIQWAAPELFHQASPKISLSDLKEVTNNPRVGTVQMIVIAQTTTVAILLEKILRPGLCSAIFLLNCGHAPFAMIECCR